MASLTLGALDLMASPYRTLVGTEWGAWESITATTSSLFLDGAVVSGEQTGNREVKLQVMVQADTRPAMIGACEALIGEANKASNILTFTADSGPSVVYELFRAHAPVRVDDESGGDLHRVYSLTFPALPFARSATREMAVAVAPGVALEEFESSFAGAMMTALPLGSSRWMCPVGSAATTPIVTTLTPALTAVTNCTIASSTATAVAAGIMELRSTSSWTVSGDLLTVAVNNTQAFGFTNIVQAGVEWLNGGGATLRIDWGAPITAFNSGYPFTAWAVSKVPAGAVSVRARFRMPAATAGQVITALEVNIIPTSLGVVGVSPYAAHLGLSGVDVPLGRTVEPTSAQHMGGVGYLYRALPASVNVSAHAQLSVWVQFPYLSGTFDPTGWDTLSVRLWDSTGRWSRYWFTGTVFPPTATWLLFAATLSSPYQSASAGAVNLADVVAYDVDLRNGMGAGPTSATVYLDSIAVGAAASALVSPRGTVLALDPILGSARTTTAVTVSSASALTDWLVAAIDGTTGQPMLTVAANVATAAGGYDGVYSILGCVAPSVSLAAPTCTIVQKIGATTVATRVLTGTQRTGYRYVDFGAVELPLVATPPENLGVSYTFTLAPSSVSWVEVLVIDVDASLAWVDNMTTARKVGWVDEPDILAGLGKVWVGQVGDRSDAQALTLPPTMSRPLQVKAPSTRLLIYSTTTAPNVTLTYYPRWLVEPS